MSVPDNSMERRVAELERRLNALEFALSRNRFNPASVQPLACRLWLATLNEDVGATTAGVAAADLLGLDETDTSKDVTLTDPFSIFTDLESGAEVVVLEQMDVDGTRFFMIIQSACP